ncbi:ribonuclease Z [Clostridium oryzae]|uniref:Ribonuclease Z n=1 Tax=Clostridium oryzae TaxID=1450648 RepID=A0A1V4IXL5_9CLOT|nr:ribonuclease Z [Clostridium oryzae]OPJ64570.1 ribonuclease Z [Clostridium oryzae]
MLDICLLGCGGSLPVPERNLTSLLLNYNGKKILIDCGEGTQVSMKILGWGFKTIDIICFTHAHADHVIGLPGILLTIANSGRETPLTIIGPPGFSSILNGLMVVCRNLPFKINYIEGSLDGSPVIDTSDLTIRSLELDHLISCIGYSVEIKRFPKFNADKAKSLNIPVKFWSILQKGQSIEFDGNTYTPNLVLSEQRKGIKVSYFTDTRPIDTIIDFVKESDLLIAEGMYGDNDELPKAVKNKHMLFSEAANIAAKANVRELWLTHFSPSLTKPEDYFQSAHEIFSNTKLGFDRIKTSLNFSND